MPNESFLTVLSGPMADKDAQFRTRQGFWLKVAREAKGVGQKEAAAACGLSTKAAISDYETGVTQVPQHRLRRLAAFYGWPLILFTEPEPTAEEQAEARIARLARAAIRLAHEDPLEEEERAPGAGDGRGAQPHRRSA